MTVHRLSPTRRARLSLAQAAAFDGIAANDVPAGITVCRIVHRVPAGKPASFLVSTLGNVRTPAAVYGVNNRASDPGMHAIRVHCLLHGLELLETRIVAGDCVYFAARRAGAAPKPSEPVSAPLAAFVRILDKAA